MPSLIPEVRNDERRESGVRYYNGIYPAVFATAKGSRMWDESGKEYLDFFCGAGALNLGHNEPTLKAAVRDYLDADGVLHALDLETPARAGFRTSLDAVLSKHGLDHSFMLAGPTGANAVEVALKLARRVTGRSTVVSFSGGFHGMSLGALSVTSNRSARRASATRLPDVVFVPFPSPDRPWTEHSLDYLADLFDSSHSGVEVPAAIILESVQAEGGVNPAPVPWLRGLAELCRDRGILLISDDIQVGCSRTGFMFSFEMAGVTPDIIVMAKALSGLGLPMSLVLYRAALEVWQPGDHNGTFRGNQLALVAASLNLAILDEDGLQSGVLERGHFVTGLLAAELARLGLDVPIRGRGLIVGVDLSSLGEGIGLDVARRCFELGLIVEPVGPGDQVVKLLPPLNVELADLELAASVVGRGIEGALADRG